MPAQRPVPKTSLLAGATHPEGARSANSGGAAATAEQALAVVAEDGGDDLTLRVRRHLAECPYASLREIMVAISKGVATLRGEVPSYYLKQIAQTTVIATPGVRRVVNELTVGSPESPAQGESPAASGGPKLPR